MKVRKRFHGQGLFSWQVDCGVVSGRRVQVSYKTKDAADAELARLKGEVKRVGNMAFALTDGDRLAYVGLRERLADVGATLEQAVAFFLSHAKPARGAITVADMIAACLVAKAADGHRPRYVGQLKCSALSFSRAGFGTRLAHEITSGDVERWLRSNQWANKTWNVYLGDLRTVFAWGIDRGYVTLNPCVGVRRKKLDDNEVAFLRAAQCRALLERAALVRPGAARRGADGTYAEIALADEDFRDCLGFVTIGLFCGLRPERELGLMDWRDVKDDLVIVSAHRAKSRGRRTVDLPANARAWLELCVRRAPDKHGAAKVLPKNFTRKWKRLREACGLLAGWPHDGIRHTFATMHLAHHRDEARLQVLMGHVSAELIYQHYRGQVTPAEAAEFWGLEPGGGKAEKLKS